MSSVLDRKIFSALLLKLGSKVSLRFLGITKIDGFANLDWTADGRFWAGQDITSLSRNVEVFGRKGAARSGQTNREVIKDQVVGIRGCKFAYFYKI